MAGPTEERTVSENGALTRLPHASLTVRVKLETPAPVGVPAMVKLPPPGCCSVSPDGSAPPVMLNTGTGANGVTQPPALVSGC